LFSEVQAAMWSVS